MYATRATALNPVRKFLLALMGHSTSPSISTDQIVQWSGIKNPLLATRMQCQILSFGLIESVSTPYHLKGSLSDQVLSEQLAHVCDNQKALLADRQGFCLAYAGFAPHEIDSLAGLCAEIAAIRLRHSSNATEAPIYELGAWQCDRLGPANDCRLQPIFIGQHQHTLLMSGEPRLNSRALADMTWMLIQRYGVTNP